MQGGQYIRSWSRMSFVELTWYIYTVVCTELSRCNRYRYVTDRPCRVCTLCSHRYVRTQACRQLISWRTFDFLCQCCFNLLLIGARFGCVSFFALNHVLRPRNADPECFCYCASYGRMQSSSSKYSLIVRYRVCVSGSQAGSVPAAHPRFAAAHATRWWTRSRIGRRRDLPSRHNFWNANVLDEAKVVRIVNTPLIL